MEKTSNRYFSNAIYQARELFSDREKLVTVLDKSFRKVVDIDNEESAIGRLVSKVKLFIKMVRAYIEGEYREVPWKSILFITASLVYFANPFDLVPDFLPGIGYLDDATVILWVFKSVEDDVNKYEEYLYNMNEV